MGNHQTNQKIQQKLNNLNLLKKNNHYQIYKDLQNIEFFKFLYIQNDQNKQQNIIKNSKTSKNINTKSIFDNQYLSLRYKWQQKNKQNKKLDYVPKILTYGNEDQSRRQSMMICSLHKLNHVIIQHPQKILKTYIEERLAIGQYFQESELLNIIHSCISALIMFQSLENQMNFSKSNKFKFTLTEENILIANNHKFIVSDLTKFIENSQKQNYAQRTIQRITVKNYNLSNQYKPHIQKQISKSRQMYYQKNLQNISLIIQSIIFKFQCSILSNKNSITQCISISTALQTNRTRINNGYSFQFQNLIKLLQRYDQNQNYLLELTESLINKIIMNKQKNNRQNSFRSIHISRNLSRRNSCQNNLKKVYSMQKQHKLTHVIIQNQQQKKIHLQQQNGQKKLNKRNFSVQSLLKYNQKGIKNFIQKNNFNNINTIKQQNYEQRRNQSKQTKIRLSLRKNSNNLNKQNINPPPKMLNRKNSMHLNLVILQNKQNKKQPINFIKNIKTDQQNLKHFLNQKQIDQQNKKKRSMLIIKDLKNKLSHQDLMNQIQLYNNNQLLTKKIEKTNKILNDNNSNLISCQESEKIYHLNPMNKKKLGGNKNSNRNSFGINCLINRKQSQNNISLLPPPINDNQIQYIQNLSSILNQNNSLSSYGIPLTDQFKTQNSQIQDQGIVQFNYQINEISTKLTKYSSIENNLNINTNKLTSFPFSEISQSLQNKNQDKIPEFLKKFKLPQKHLLALNNIILKQKDMIVEQSFEQSDLNSFRKSIPNLIVSSNYHQQTQQLKKRTSKIIEQLNSKILQEFQKSNYQKNNQISIIQ